jgi:hypothetical protein
MPLERGRAIGYDVIRMTSEFTMMDDKVKVVDCHAQVYSWSGIYDFLDSQVGFSSAPAGGSALSGK